MTKVKYNYFCTLLDHWSEDTVTFPDDISPESAEQRIQEADTTKDDVLAWVVEYI